jgi:hypothetical protein
MQASRCFGIPFQVYQLPESIGTFYCTLFIGFWICTSPTRGQLFPLSQTIFLLRAHPFSGFNLVSDRVSFRQGLIRLPFTHRFLSATQEATEKTISASTCHISHQHMPAHPYQQRPSNSPHTPSTPLTPKHNHATRHLLAKRLAFIRLYKKLMELSPWVNPLTYPLPTAYALHKGGRLYIIPAKSPILINQQKTYA